jgi:hypothetical protein
VLGNFGSAGQHPGVPHEAGRRGRFGVELLRLGTADKMLTHEHGVTG